MELLVDGHERMALARILNTITWTGGADPASAECKPSVLVGRRDGHG